MQKILKTFEDRHPRDYQYDLVVLIGRFSPFHNAHADLKDIASRYAPNVLILVGSAERALSIKNPWTFEEREQMIRNSPTIFRDGGDVFVEPLLDFGTNAQWIEEVGHIVDQIKDSHESKIAIIGHDKDHSSFYLNFFPQWDYIEAPAFPDHGETIDATKIRQLWFEKEIAFIEGVLPAKTYKMLLEQSRDGSKQEMYDEWKAVKAYKKSWETAPYEPTFVTVDAVVVQSGHVLLIQRGGQPGKGQWAMPGGFLDPKERIKDAVIRELREETGIKVQERILKRCIVDQQVFDDPGRSTRGRTITHTFLFWLDDAEKLPRVKASDDADDTKWVSFADFENMRSVMYEDHFFQIQAMINKNITEEF